MIIESLRVLLFGMAGIFTVMGIIALSLHLLSSYGKEE